MTLSLNDLQLLTALVGSLHEASPDSVAERPAVARKLESLLGIDVMSHIVRHEANPVPIHTSTWGRDLQLNADYKQYFHAVDPISPLLHRRADPLLVEGIIARRSLQRTEYFTDFLTRYKVYPGMSLCLDAGGGTLLDYRLGTSEVGRVFGERELRILDLLRPHLINAHRQRAFAALEGDEHAASSRPSFVLDPAQAPQPNRAAEALMAGWEASEREGLLLLLSRIALGASEPMQWAGFDLCTKFEHAADGRIVHRLYLTAGTVGSGAWFQQKFKVTRREGEVCELLLKGLSDKQISKALNISYWTVRSHVGRVLDKLGIESRSAVAARVIAAR